MSPKESLLIALTLTTACCGPSLTEQQGLARRTLSAAKDCKAKFDDCGGAKVCAERAQIAQMAIQSAQEARAKGQSTSDLEADAAGAYAAADVACKRWR